VVSLPAATLPLLMAKMLAVLSVMVLPSLRGIELRQITSKGRARRENAATPRFSALRRMVAGRTGQEFPAKAAGFEQLLPASGRDMPACAGAWAQPKIDP
jgi:hypothetical protein